MQAIRFSSKVLFAFLLALALLLGALSSFAPFTRPSEASAHYADCQPPMGCITRESGTNAGWWATSWFKASSGICAGDWQVTYSTTWWKYEWWPRVRLWGASWSKVSWTWPWPYTDMHIQTFNAQSSFPPGITVCLGGGRYSENDIKGSYVWLTP